MSHKSIWTKFYVVEKIENTHRASTKSTLREEKRM